MTTVGEASRAALFFDVDGTLMGGDRPNFKQGEPMPKLSVEAFMAERPSDAVMAAFGRLRAQDHAPFICTGRPFFMITPGVRALEPVGYVAEAGAYVRIGDEVIRDEHIPRDLVRETAARFVEAGVNVELESNEIDVGLYPAGGECPFPGCPTVRTLDELEPYLARYHFAKLGTHGVGRERIERLLPFLEEHFTISDMQFGTYDISLKGLDKGEGIACALAHMGHGRANTFAFGDSENDLSMAPAVETFVAMGNALPGVKAAADYVTDSVQNDGVATALARFGLL